MYVTCECGEITWVEEAEGASPGRCDRCRQPLPPRLPPFEHDAYVLYWSTGTCAVWDGAERRVILRGTTDDWSWEASPEMPLVVLNEPVIWTFILAVGATGWLASETVAAETMGRLVLLLAGIVLTSAVLLFIPALLLYCKFRPKSWTLVAAESSGPSLVTIIRSRLMSRFTCRVVGVAGNAIARVLLPRAAPPGSCLAAVAGDELIVVTKTQGDEARPNERLHAIRCGDQVLGSCVGETMPSGAQRLRIDVSANVGRTLDRRIAVVLGLLLLVGEGAAPPGSGASAS